MSFRGTRNPSSVEKPSHQVLQLMVALDSDLIMDPSLGALLSSMSETNADRRALHKLRRDGNRRAMTD